MNLGQYNTRHVIKHVTLKLFKMFVILQYFDGILLPKSNVKLGMHMNILQILYSLKFIFISESLFNIIFTLANHHLI